MSSEAERMVRKLRVSVWMFFIYLFIFVLEVQTEHNNNKIILKNIKIVIIVNKKYHIYLLIIHTPHQHLVAKAQPPEYLLYVVAPLSECLLAYCNLHNYHNII